MFANETKIDSVIFQNDVSLNRTQLTTIFLLILENWPADTIELYNAFAEFHISVD